MKKALIIGMLSKTANPQVAALAQPNIRRTGWTILAFDLIAILLAIVVGLLIRHPTDFSTIGALYSNFWPVLIMFVLTYSFAGLYPGVGIPVPEELRRLTYSTSLVFVLAGASTFMYKSAGEYSRIAFVFAWVICLVAVPLARAIARELFARKLWWGAGVVVLGAGEIGQKVTRSLLSKPGLGLKPVALLDDDPQKQGLIIQGVRVEGMLGDATHFAATKGVRYGLVAMPGLSSQQLLEISDTYGRKFSHLLVVPDLLGFSSLLVQFQDLGGVPSLEIRQRLTSPRDHLIKRILDAFVITAVALPTLSITCIVSFFIRFDSRGSAFYRQKRLGLNNELFDVIKFRTMHGDGEARLQTLLEQNPELKREYATFHKLRNDPRVTNVGRFLRKTSLDELPQIWNVLRGEMSIIGPRAYLPREQHVMGDNTKTILRVLPGITGLWQVSGRNELSFAERVALDVYYVRNWSLWLDIYILARTFWIMLFVRGAY